MIDLVEHVARALCVSAGEIPDTPTPANRHVDFLWQHYRKDALAAIRATIEHQRDNVSHQQIADGWAQLRRARLPHLGAGPGLQDAYRAMLDARLKDLDKEGWAG